MLLDNGTPTAAEGRVVTDPTEAKLLEQARRLAGVCAERAAEAERERRLPQDLSEQFAQAGFYRLGVPAQIGGLEQSITTCSRIFETLAQGDASCAWVAFIGATSGTSLAQVPQQTAQELFAAPTTMVAGAIAPSGRAEMGPDGFVVNGTWQWGSGTQNADWILGGCRLSQDGEPMLDKRGQQRAPMLLMPAGEVEFLDTWHVSGLRGTGSTHYRVADLVVPPERVVGGSRQDWATGALYRVPVFTFLASGIGAVALGVARAAIDELVELAQGKRRLGNAKTIAEQSTAQTELALAEARLRGARSFYYEALEAAWAFVQGGEMLSLELRRDLRLATTHAVRSSAQVVDAVYTLAGGGAVYESSRLQRMFRDVHVATQHIMVGPFTLETTGRLLFGLDANTATL